MPHHFTEKSRRRGGVAAGSADNSSDADFAVAVFTTFGTLDPTYGGTGQVGDGKFTTDFAGDSDYARGVAIQPDGKIVAAGYTTYGYGKADFALARYQASGNSGPEENNRKALDVSGNAHK